MNDPRAFYEEKLQRLARAGGQGLDLVDIGVGTAVHFEVHRFAVIQQDVGRVQITGQGRAHAQRQVFA